MIAPQQAANAKAILILAHRGRDQVKAHIRENLPKGHEHRAAVISTLKTITNRKAK